LQLETESFVQADTCRSGMGCCAHAALEGVEVLASLGFPIHSNPDGQKDGHQILAAEMAALNQISLALMGRAS
jgi:hypothetical protein